MGRMRHMNEDRLRTIVRRVLSGQRIVESTRHVDALTSKLNRYTMNLLHFIAAEWENGIHVSDFREPKTATALKQLVNQGLIRPVGRTRGDYVATNKVLAAQELDVNDE